MSVRHHQQPGFHRHVVPRDLVEHHLRDFDLWRFAFHQNEYGTVIVKHNDVVALRDAVDFQDLFYVDERFWVILFLHQVMNDMLAHPFFRRQHDEFFSDFIENQCLVIAFPEAEFTWRKVQ